MKKYFLASFVFVLVCSAAALSSGCHKKKDTLCNIYVLDTANAYVPNARVELKGVPSSGSTGVSTVDVTVYTNSAGVAAFDFSDNYQLGQAGVFVLNIIASHGTLSGTGIVKIEEETTSEQTVFIQ